MNKRLILAVALSFLVMMTWAKLAQKFYPIERQEVTEERLEPTPPFIPSKEQEKIQEQEQIQELESENLVSAISHSRELVFSLPSASLNKVIFSQFEDHVFDLGSGLTLVEQGLNFTQEKLTSEEAIFVHHDDQKRITKRFNYSDPNYIVTLEIKIENLSEQSLPHPSNLIIGTVNFTPKGSGPRRAGLWLTEVFVKQPDKILRLNPRKEIKTKESGEFFGFRDNYFCAIIIPLSFPEMLQVRRMDRTESQLVLSRPTIELSPNQVGRLQYNIYLGPQQAGLLKSFQNGAEQVIYYGLFDPIAKLLLKILRFFARFLNNWGWAIVMLSIVIFFVLFPLSLKQMRSAKAMQSFQPKVEELRRVYKDNPQRLNKETLELYRKHKINPLGGCVPMFLQIPIFFSFYLTLSRLLELKGAQFLWIQDLSRPDRLVESPEINILPILMAITMFLQQRFSMMPAAGPTGEQQRLMSLLFPVLFGFILYRMPAGLVLYWFINSLLMFIYQMKIKGQVKPQLSE